MSLLVRMLLAIIIQFILLVYWVPLLLHQEFTSALPWLTAAWAHQAASQHLFDRSKP